MKAEERKELEQNSLLRWLNESYQDIKAGPSKTVWYIVGGIALIAAIWGGWWWFSKEQDRKNSDLWEQLDAASDTEKLKKLADENRGTTQANVADLQRARLKLREGTASILNPGDYAKASKSLTEAVELFDKIAAQFDKTAPLMAQESLLGAGKAKEALGELDKAKDYYEKVVKKDEARANKQAPASAFAVEAKAGIARIDGQKATLESLTGVLKKPQ